MDFALTDEQQELSRIVRALLERHAGSAAVRAAAITETGYDADLWRLLSEEVGAAALAIPEEFGGAGFSWFETALVLEAVGYSLAPTPLLASAVLAADALLLSSNDEACERLLPAIAEGSSIGTVAWADRSGHWRTDGSDVTATPADSWVLDGTARLVLDGTSADVVLVVATTSNGVGLFEVADENGLVRTTTPAVDPTLRLATLEFAATPARLLLDDACCDGGAAGAGIRRRCVPAGGRGPTRARHDRRVLEATSAVRPRDRQLPGAQAPDGGHARRRRDLAHRGLGRRVVGSRHRR